MTITETINDILRILRDQDLRDLPEDVLEDNNQELIDPQEIKDQMEELVQRADFHDVLSESLGEDIEGLNAKRWYHVHPEREKILLEEGTCVSPYEMLPSDLTTDSAQTDTWSVNGGPVVGGNAQSGYDGVIWKGPRVTYDTTTKILRFWAREMKMDSLGILVSLSAESGYTINTPVDCTGV